MIMQVKSLIVSLKRSRHTVTPIGKNSFIIEGEARPVLINLLTNLDLQWTLLPVSSRLLKSGFGHGTKAMIGITLNDEQKSVDFRFQLNGIEFTSSMKCGTKSEQLYE